MWIVFLLNHLLNRHNPEVNRAIKKYCFLYPHDILINYYTWTFLCLFFFSTKKVQSLISVSCNFIAAHTHTANRSIRSSNRNEASHQKQKQGTKRNQENETPDGMKYKTLSTPFKRKRKNIETKRNRKRKANCKKKKLQVITIHGGIVTSAIASRFKYSSTEHKGKCLWKRKGGMEWDGKSRTTKPNHTPRNTLKTTFSLAIIRQSEMSLKVRGDNRPPWLWIGGGWQLYSGGMGTFRFS